MRLKPIYAVLFFLIVTLLLTCPLIFNLDKLHGSLNFFYNYDTNDQINRMEQTKGKILNCTSWIEFEEFDSPFSYRVFGAILMMIFGISSMAAHNIFFLLALFLSGLCMYLLANEFLKDELSCILAGFIYMSSNFIFSFFIWGHVNHMQMQWLPLVFLLTDKMLRNPNIKNAIFFGSILFYQLISSFQYTVYLSFFLVVYFLLKIKEVKKNNIQFFILGIVMFCLLSYPFIAERLGTQAPTRNLEENMTEEWILNLSKLTNNTSNLFFGTVQLSLVILSFFFLIKYERLIPWLIIFIIALVCSFGPFSSIAPYTILYKFWPFFSKFRVPMRIFVFAWMPACLLIGLSFKKICENVSIKKRLIVFCTLLIILFIQVLNSSWVFVSLFLR